ncbi:MAG: Ig domain-containing protein, partial [Gemmatimonadota bacterium]|nr:Ig domain-containing protein [Gemmatimonadota bacterium]
YDMDAVVAKTYDLIQFILDKYEAGRLTAPTGMTVEEGVTELITLLFTYAGIDATVCAIGTDCDFGYYAPGSPTFTLTAPSGFARLQAPPGTGTVTQPTILSVYRLTPDNDLTMLYLQTELDQYPLQYEFSTSSGEEFLQYVTLTVCLADDVFPPDVSRLRLAHNVAEPAPFENIQILPLAGGGSLDCTNATPTLGAAGQPSLLRQYAMRGFRALTAALTPQPLQAATLAGTGITGSSKNLSPFGIVDPLGLISANSATSTAALEGSAVTAPSVQVATPNQYDMAGIAVTFTITAGGGCFGDNPCTPSSPTTHTVDTDASGIATAPSWTIGLGINTVSASGTIPCAAPVAAGTVADCGTIQTAGGGSSLTFSATGYPAVSNIAPSTLAAGVKGSVYPGATFTASGGDGTYSWAVTTGALPAGLSLSGAGALSGTPTVDGSFDFTVTVTSGPITGTQAYTLTILPPAVITSPTSPLTTGGQGSLYPNTAFTATGGTGSYSWAVTSGALPAGLSLSAAGTLTGTPTTNGSFSFTVTVTSGPATGTGTYSLTILPPVVITPATLPGATVGVPYSQTLSAAGGTGTYSWSGSGLPAWATATLPTVGGTPTAAGSWNFSVTASSVGGPGSGTQSYSVTATYPGAVTLAFQPGPSGSQCYAINAIMTPNIGVKVTTTSGAPLSGVPVSLVAVLNNGSTVQVSNGTATTGANGIAVFT